MPVLVHETAPLPTTRGGSVKLRLLVLDVHGQSEIRIDREEQLPHKALASIVLRIRHPSHGIEPLARSMTTIVHELERLHQQGYSIRERAGGGWRGAWRSELLAGNGTATGTSWEIELRKPERTLEPLAHLLQSLDVPAPRIDTAAAHSSVLAAAMREHGSEVRRKHAIEALIASDPLLPGDEFVEELESRGLLTSDGMESGS